GGVKVDDVKDSLGRMSLGERRAVTSEYAGKYGLADMKSDLTGKADKEDREQIEYLSRSEALSADLRYHKAEDKSMASDTFASGLMDFAGYGAARKQMMSDL